MPERPPGTLRTTLAATVRILAGLLAEVRVVIAERRTPVLVEPDSTATASAQAEPAPPAPMRPPLPPTGIQLFIAAPSQPDPTPLELDATSGAEGTEPADSRATGDGLSVGIAAWVASLPRVVAGDRIGRAGSDLRRRLDAWRERHRLTRVGLLVLTLLAPIAVAFLVNAGIELLAGR